MSGQIDRIKGKIEQLKQLNKEFSLFGSETHQYELNPALSLDKIRHFETTHNVTLPGGYVDFLTKIGNGGAGPFYGLEPLEDTLYDDLHYKRPDSLLNPGQPFIYTKHWNLEFQSSISQDSNQS